jgi:hypothetical protein
MKIRKKALKIVKRHPQWQKWHDAWWELPKKARTGKKLWEISCEYMTDINFNQHRTGVEK